MIMILNLNGSRKISALAAFHQHNSITAVQPEHCNRQAVAHDMNFRDLAALRQD